MRQHVVSILVALALIAPVNAATAASKSPKLAKCDGKKRRQANPYGSILPTVDPLAGTATSSNQGPAPADVHVFPERAAATPGPTQENGEPPTQVPPISSANPPTAYRSC
ncbi:MAG: hypothetical protein ACREVW_09195 [Burkholderiales bacterium]